MAKKKSSKKNNKVTAKGTKRASRKEPDMAQIQAVQNANLSDGTFVPEGEVVEVSKEYAKRIEAEGDNQFRIIRK